MYTKDLHKAPSVIFFYTALNNWDRINLSNSR